ncbi:shikimate dehydrogenase [Helicobacter suis]|uniref:shikimate dehydrogenase n=1 Tax=Helicobacter suis TaxID=104628 RepID=UPI0013D5F58A|nr:shikimate dehydrogenase [Helicobacter suis]
MRLFGVFGNPIAHSKSPLLHNAVLARYEKELLFKGSYHPLLLDREANLKEKFLELHLSGANITTPFKEKAFVCSDVIKGVAKEIGAVNAWVLEGEQIVGYNTDVEGFLYPLQNYTFSSALILGAGGSARAITHALKSRFIQIEILNRSTPKLDYFKALGFNCFTPQDFKIKPYDLIINTTTAGLKEPSLPCDLEMLKALLKRATLAYDLIYQHTPFLNLAKQEGLITLDGKAMLIAQAALSFLYFCDHKLPFEVILQTMQEVLL